MSLVILDRDGVINFDSDATIKSPEEWMPIPGSSGQACTAQYRW
jgi:D-glycero-D-manno-heptose 1,7-bisphosphate phosphatase